MSKLAPVRRRVELEGGKIPYLDIAYWPDEDRFHVGIPLTDYDTVIERKDPNDRRPGRASRIMARIVPRVQP